MGGSSETVSGYNYFGSFAIAVCVGPVKRLHRITNGDTDIFVGPIESSSADPSGRSTLSTTIGTIHFYWGTPTQQINDLLNSLEIDLGSGKSAVPMPAFRNICYAVCEDVAFGNQVTPPTLRFEIETELNVLDLSTHAINGDVVIPEAVYEYLTNPFYGAALSPLALDTDSFVAAAETVIGEGLSGTPELDTTESVRDTLSRMLSCVDGFVYFEAGKLKLKLIRKTDTTNSPAITEADLLEEPELNARHGDTWNLTRVVFRDRDNKWEETPEPFVDGANASIVGRIVEKDFQFPWITRREAAKVLAKHLGIKGGIPPAYWSLKLKPEWSSLLPGDLIKLSYAKLGIVNRVCRVTEVAVGGPSKPAVSVDCIEEQTRDTSHDYVPPEDEFGIPGILDSSGTGAFDIVSTAPRVSALPEALKEGRFDGILLAAERPDDFARKVALHWTYDPELFTYQKLDEREAFPVKGEVVAWWVVTDDQWRFRLRLSDSDYDTLLELVKYPDVLCVVGRRDYKSVGSAKDEHQTLSPWLIRPVGGEVVPVTANVIDLELKGGHFNTADFLLETLGDDGRYPTIHAYLGLQPNFLIYASDTIKFDRAGANAPDDSGQVRYFKAPVSNHVSEETVTDAPEVTWDRDDATMCATGTFSRDWGARALTAYEQCDVQFAAHAMGNTADDYETIADLDEALGAVFEGAATATQAALVAHVDNVLGLMAGTTQNHYNE